MKSNWVSIKDWLNDDGRREEKEKLFVDYKPDEGEFLFSKDKTGNAKDLKMLTERNIGGWHPNVATDGTVVFVAGEPTKFELKLHGSHGWANLEALVNESISACYSNAELNTVGSSMTKLIFKGLSAPLKEIEETYLLADKCKARDYLSIYYVDNGEVKEQKLAFVDGNVSECQIALRPVILLPENMVVNIGDVKNNGDTPEKGLKIRNDIELTKKNYKQ